MMAQPAQFVSKHPFQGDVRQAQLSFGKGAIISAKPGQEGAWWWGVCNGKEGWFPPTYVAPMAQSPPPQQQPSVYGGQPTQQQQISMQQRMQQASFAPSVKQQQMQRPAGVAPHQGMPAAGVYGQPQAGFGAAPQQQVHQQPGYGQPPSLNFQPAGLAAARPPPQQQFVPASDPFAGLENMNSLMPSSGQATASVPIASIGGGIPPIGGPHTQQQQFPVSPALTTQSAPSLPTQAKLDPTTAALARMGIGSAGKTNTPNQSMTPTPIGSRSVSPMPSSGAAASASPPIPIQQQGGKGASPSAVGTSMQRARSMSPGSVASSGSKSPSMAQRAVEEQQARSKSPSNLSAGSKSATPPVILTKEEAEAKRLREQEEAQQKARMRREKEEMRNAQNQAATGIGSSGFALQVSGSGEFDLALPVQPGGIEPTFNPYDFLAGTTGGLPTRKFSPIFRVPPFWALMNLETYVRRFPLAPEKLADRAAAYQQLAKALSFVCHVVAESDEATKAGRGRFALLRSGDKQRGPLSFLKFNHLGCEACIKLISILPHSAGASGKVLDGLFLNFINVFVSLIENLQANQQIVVPGGWQQPEYTHLCLYIVRNCGDGSFSFTVCNTGKDGLQYHPATFDSETGRELKQLSMTIWNIRTARMTDSTFWTLLFRMQVYPSKRNDAEFLYTKLLPALNAQPLRSNLDQGPAEYLEVPDAISASSYHPLAKLAITTTPQAGMRSSKYSSFLLMNAAVDLAYAEIESAPASSMDPEDTRILKLTGRNLANFASTMDVLTVGDGTLGVSLSSTWDLLDKLHKKISFTSSKGADQYQLGLSKSALSDEFSKGFIASLRTDAGSAAHPLFGRLRRDDYENVVKKLMGDPRPDPILIPAVLTDEELPPIATDYSTAASSLQRVADACSLLLQQRRLIKNAPAFAASAAQYAMTVILPMPKSDPRYCFWRRSGMRRETQLNLLFLIRRMCRIYSAATACVQQSRGLVAIRSIAFACATCVADAICRVKAVDDPSTFAMHYSGLCEGPTEPFAIEAGSFDTLGSNLPIYDPNICSLRFQCLDYMRELTLKMSGDKRNTIFNFDASMTPMEGDLVLITQLSIQLALVRPFPATDEAMINHSANLISGKNGSIIEVLPEFEYFRDIVFHFKHAVSGKAQTAEVAETQAWLPSDATLHWNVKRKDKEDPRLYFNVSAFHGHPQEFVERVAIEHKVESAFKGFLSLFSSKQKAVRARLSSADPTTVVNSCGDKFLSKK
jgi:predicted DNA-binding protein (UPF0251 family)